MSMLFSKHYTSRDLIISQAFFLDCLKKTLPTIRRTWLVRWLNTHNIKFAQAKGAFKREYSGYGYKFKEIEI